MLATKSRMFIYLSLSLVLVPSLMLINWSMNFSSTTAAQFSFAIIYIMGMFAIMCGMTIYKTMQTDNIDFNQEKLNLIFEAIKITENENRPIIPEVDINEVVDFDYSKAPAKRPLPPHVDQTLQF